MQHKFPFTALFFQINPEKVDVNVHPAKREVRFQNSEELYHIVYRAVNDALTGKELIPEVSFDPARRKPAQERPAAAPAPEPFEIKRKQAQAALSKETAEDPKPIPPESKIRKTGF